MRLHIIAPLLLLLAYINPVISVKVFAQEPAAELLFTTLRIGTVTERRNAINEIAKLASIEPRNIPMLFQAWNDDDLVVRSNSYLVTKDLAAQLVNAWNSDEAQPLSTRAAIAELNSELDKILRSENKVAILNSFAIITILEKLSVDLYPSLANLLILDDGMIRIASIFSWIKNPDPMAKILISSAENWINSEDENKGRAFRIVSTYFLKDLFRLDQEDRNSLCKLYTSVINSDNLELRYSAAQAIGIFCSDESTELLRKALTDDWIQIRIEAIKSMSKIGPASLPIARDSIIGDDNILRYEAIRAMANIYNSLNAEEKSSLVKSTLNQENLNALEAILFNRNSDVKLKVLTLETFGDMGLLAISKIDTLNSFTRSESPRIRLQTISTFESIFSDSVSNLKSLSKNDIENLKLIIESLHQTIISPYQDDQLPALSALNVITEKLKSNSGQEDDPVPIKLLIAKLTIILQNLADLIDTNLEDSKKIKIARATATLQISPSHVIPYLIKQLNSEEQYSAQSALSEYRQHAIPYLISALRSDDIKTKESILNTIYNTLNGQKENLPKLNKEELESIDRLTSSDNKKIRWSALGISLLYIDLDPIAAGTVVKVAVTSPDSQLRAYALEKMANANGYYLSDFIPKLAAEIAKDGYIFTQTNLAQTNRVFESTRETNKAKYLTDLNIILNHAQLNPELINSKSLNNLKEKIEYLELIKSQEFRGQLVTFYESNMLLVLMTAAYAAWIVITLFLMRTFPLSILRINQLLTPLEITLPSKLGGYRLPLRFVLFIGFFEYHPLVIDAWVKQHRLVMRERFSTKPTVRQRSVHVTLPVRLDDNGLVNLESNVLKKIFSKQLATLLIWGEGGAGKTSLACKLGTLAMSEEREYRLASHIMIPVLIENESALDLQSSTMLEDAVNHQIQDLCDLSRPPSRALVQQLLQKKRILVIIDHLSEMSEAVRNKLKSELITFPASALIVTTRIESDMDEFSKSVMRPIRIEGNRLSSFMESYLDSRGIRDRFSDVDFFKGCSHLSKIVGEREITALFATLYAEEMIASRQKSTLDHLPDSIPDMILSYTNELNKSITNPFLSDREAHTIAKAVAWECLKKNYLPGNTHINTLEILFGKEKSQLNLDYLENKLRLIQAVPPAKHSYRFLLDPIAEYFAAMQVCELNSDSTTRWSELVQDISQQKYSLIQINGFLRALYDCAENLSEIQVPPAILEQLRILSKGKRPRLIHSAEAVLE